MSGRKADDFATDRVAKPTMPHGEATQESPALATLVRYANGAEQQVHPLLADYFVIGRGRECHIQIRNDTSISRKHAAVKRSGVRFVIEDLNSSNGVFVNNERLTGPHELQVDDKVEIGSQMFVFKRRA
jgi:pSer/pThr/pTyr-binding forkhead associated (FHA) protein